MLNNKRGQIGETITWLVATLIIIFLLSTSIYAASLLSKSKVLNYDGGDRSQDVVMEKSLFAHFLVEGSNIYSAMQQMDEEEKFYDNFNSNYEKIKFNLGTKNE